MRKKLTHTNAELGMALGFMPDGAYDKLACIPDYDAAPVIEKGRKLIRFYGDVTYEVVNRCEYGCGYHCRRIWYRGVRKSRAGYKARCEALLGGFIE